MCIRDSFSPWVLFQTSSYSTQGPLHLIINYPTHVPKKIIFLADEYILLNFYLPYKRPFRHLIPFVGIDILNK